MINVKIIIYDDRLLIAGKAWEIKTKLKEAKTYYDTIEQWIQSIHGPTCKQSETVSATAWKKCGSSAYVRPID